MLLSLLLCCVTFDLPLIQFVTNDADGVVAVVKCGHFSFFFLSQVCDVLCIVITF